jgi:hypothetical protein
MIQRRSDCSFIGAPIVVSKAETGQTYFRPRSLVATLILRARSSGTAGVPPAFVTPKGSEWQRVQARTPAVTEECARYCGGVTKGNRSRAFEDCDAVWPIDSHAEEV